MQDIVTGLAGEIEQSAAVKPAMGLFPVEPHRRECKIWAVGGGKGGTGKSFITSSLGCGLADRGNKVVMIDADLGGANLHSFFGVKNTGKSLTEFFDNKIPLKDLIVPAGFGGMGLITGDVRSLDSANINHAQKLKLFRHIKSLDADYVLLDLGGGSHSNVLDSFLLADKMIVVIVPEVTAIENMYQFIKNVFFRKLKMVFADMGLKHVLAEAWKDRGELGIANLKELVEYLRANHPEAASAIDRELVGFTVHLVLNQVRVGQSISIGDSVRSVFRKYMGFYAQYAGYVEHDDCVWRSLNSGRPFLQAYPASSGARELVRLVGNLTGGTELRTVNS